MGKKHKARPVLANKFTTRTAPMKAAKKVMIASPMYSGQCFGVYTQGRELANLELMKKNIGVAMCQVTNESLIQRARNTCAWHFLNSKADYLMFIDADIGFQPNSISSMVEADCDIIGGAYPLKSVDFARAIEAHKRGVKIEALAKYASKSVVQLRDKKNVEIKLDQPVEVDFLGTGFMLIHRRVFEAMIAADEDNWYFDPNNKMNKTFVFFDCELERDRRVYLSEDYYFCKKARNLGFKIMLAPWISLTHTGTYTFQGDFVTSNGGIYPEDLAEPAKEES